MTARGRFGEPLLSIEAHSLSGAHYDVLTAVSLDMREVQKELKVLKSILACKTDASTPQTNRMAAGMDQKPEGSRPKTRSQTRQEENRSQNQKNSEFFNKQLYELENAERRPKKSKSTQNVGTSPGYSFNEEELENQSQETDGSSLTAEDAVPGNGLLEPEELSSLNPSPHMAPQNVSGTPMSNPDSVPDITQRLGIQIGLQMGLNRPTWNWSMSYWITKYTCRTKWKSLDLFGENAQMNFDWVRMELDKLRVQSAKVEEYQKHMIDHMSKHKEHLHVEMQRMEMALTNTILQESSVVRRSLTAFLDLFKGVDQKMDVLLEKERTKEGRLINLERILENLQESSSDSEVRAESRMTQDTQLSSATLDQESESHFMESPRVPSIESPKVSIQESSSVPSVPEGVLVDISEPEETQKLGKVEEPVSQEPNTKARKLLRPRKNLTSNPLRSLQ